MRRGSRGPCNDRNCVRKGVFNRGRKPYSTSCISRPDRSPCRFFVVETGVQGTFVAVDPNEYPLNHRFRMSRPCHAILLSSSLQSASYLDDYHTAPLKYYIYIYHISGYSNSPWLLMPFDREMSSS